MKRKIILSISILSLLSLVVFVSALSYETEKEWIVPIHKGWNLVSSGLVLGNGAYTLDSTTCTNEDIEGGYFYIHPTKISEITTINDTENKYFAYRLKETSINGDKVLTADVLYNEDEIMKALGVTPGDLDELRKIDNEYGDFYGGGLSIWINSESDCQLSYKIAANQTDNLVDLFSEEWFSQMPQEIVIDNDTNRIYPVLLKGWNLMSITPGLIELGSLSKFKGCNIKKAYMYESNKQKWVEVSLSANLTESDAFQGLIIDVEDFCELYLE